MKRQTFILHQWIANKTLQATSHSTTANKLSITCFIVIEYHVTGPLRRDGWHLFQALHTVITWPLVDSSGRRPACDGRPSRPRSNDVIQWNNSSWRPLPCSSSSRKATVITQLDYIEQNYSTTTATILRFDENVGKKSHRMSFPSAPSPAAAGRVELHFIKLLLSDIGKSYLPKDWKYGRMVAHAHLPVHFFSGEARSLAK